MVMVEMAEELYLVASADISVSTAPPCNYSADSFYRPGVLHSSIALITTMINVYTAQDGIWTATSVVSITLIGACFFYAGVGACLYGHILLVKIR